MLLLGPSFTSDEAPWPQAAHVLDLSDSSAAEFVGALECAAQAAGVRALVLIDALNEGKGLSVWPTMSESETPIDTLYCNPGTWATLAHVVLEV